MLSTTMFEGATASWWRRGLSPLMMEKGSVAAFVGAAVLLCSIGVLHKAARPAPAVASLCACITRLMSKAVDVKRV